MNKTEISKMNVPNTNVLYCFNLKENKVEIYVADKKFRTLEQFLSGEGQADVSVLALPFQKRTNRSTKCFSPSGKLLMSIEEANSDVYELGYCGEFYKGYYCHNLRVYYGRHYCKDIKTYTTPKDFKKLKEELEEKLKRIQQRIKIALNVEKDVRKPLTFKKDNTESAYKIVKYNNETGEMYVPYTHIFYCFNYEDNKTEMYIADDEYKKFQTVGQFLAGHGETKIKVEALPFKKRTNRNIKCYSPAGKMLMSVDEANSEVYYNSPFTNYKGIRKDYVLYEYGQNYWIHGERFEDKYFHSIRNISDFELLHKEINKHLDVHWMGIEKGLNSKEEQEEDESIFIK